MSSMAAALLACFYAIGSVGIGADAEMAKRACLQCGAAFSGEGSYCSRHRRVRNADPAGRGYGSVWKRKSRAIRTAWVNANGLVCPGTKWCVIPNVAHHCLDLTVDHDRGEVMCRSANSRKGAGEDRWSDKPKGGNRVVRF